MFYWNHLLKISISNRQGEEKELKERITSSEELTSEELRKIAGEVINDLHPDWCLVRCDLTEVKKESFL